MRWWWWIVIVLFVAWQCHSVYQVWVPQNLCTSNDCWDPAFDFSTQRFDLCFFGVSGERNLVRGLQIIKGKKPFFEKLVWDVREPFEEDVVVPLVGGVRSNGTMSVIVTVSPTSSAGCSASPTHFTEAMSSAVPLTRYLPVTFREARFLLYDDSSSSSQHPSHVVTTHWKPWTQLRLVLDSNSYIRPDPSYGSHVPHVFFDETLLLRRHLRPLSLNTSLPDPAIKLRFTPTSVGAHRLLAQVSMALQQTKQSGLISEEDLDEVVALLSPDRLYVLILTYVVSMLHTLFAALAFKNDISFWRAPGSMQGMSRRSVLGNAICSVIITLYLWEQRQSTSWIIVGTQIAQVLIDLWKVWRVLRLWQSEKEGRQKKEESSSSHDVDISSQTEEWDAKGMRYLWFLLGPLVIVWAVYSLIHHAHRSWYAWLIQSLANAVYAFGFLLMWPQVFLNYKLQSVAHLPWRALTYKIFSTFVDDLFAYLIQAPLMHRLATLRDDVVFFVYLYQRFRYRVDYSRVNEFGQQPQEEKPKTE